MAHRFRQLVTRRLLEQDASSLEIGHFVIIDHLGSGGMGSVFRAYDRELGRPVALKLLHAHLSAKASDRLRREARAMAKLSHPNVVQVYEVGEAQGRVFVAMELVEGQTLAQWMKREPRPGWRECVELFLRLGEGLAAAHDEGLIHRDFKPSNAIIDDEGRPRVLDFGLARLATEDELDGEPLGTTEDRSLEQSLGSEPLATPLTQTGEVMGTPAYMPLEQLEGRPVDARGDQYCFCVSLFEAVYGERPVGADTIAGQMEALRAGVSPTPPSGTKVPAALHAALLRGLEADPERRWPSMAALLGELRRVVAPGRTRWIAAGLLVGAIGVGGGLLLGRTMPSPAAEVCTGAQEQLWGVWDDQRREAVGAAILGTGLAYAEDTWGRVEHRLDEYAREWTAQHQEACEATHVRAEQSSEMMDRRMRCLHRARADLAAVVDVLLELEGRELATVPRLLVQLEPPARCADTEALQLEHAPPRAEDAAAVEEAIERLARVRAATRAGRFVEAEQEQLRVDALLERVEHEPTLAQQEIHRGELAIVRHDWEVAEAAFETALELSSRSRDWSTLLVALGDLMYVCAYQQKSEQGFAYREIAKGLAVDEPVRLAFIHRQTSELLRAEGELGRAERELREALQLLEGQSSPLAESETSKSLLALARVLQSRGELVRAETVLRRALEHQQEHFGPRHPNTSITKANLAALGMLTGEWPRARELAEHSRRVLEGSDAEPSDQAAALFQLARASWELAEEGSRARTEALSRAEDAAEMLRGAGPAAARVHAEVQRWIDARRGGEPEATAGSGPEGARSR